MQSRSVQDRKVMKMTTLTAAPPPPTPIAMAFSRSLGMKLILVSVMALLMTIPSLFVGHMVGERSHWTADTTDNAQVHTIPGLPLRAVDSYRAVHRSLKYVLLFLGLVFGTYFVFEATTGKRVHPAQYGLVGLAQLIFYLLLLSLAEKTSFDEAFAIAGAGTVTLLSVNAGWVFGSASQRVRGFAVFSVLYGVIYVLLRVEQDALLIGAIASFLVVASVMFVTRKLDWYSSLSSLTAASSEPASLPAMPQG